MKLPTGLRSFQSLRDVATTIGDMAKAIATGWAVEHRPDGTHTFPWVDLPIESAKFVGYGAMTWEVLNTDQVLYAYRLVGDSCLICWRIKESDVGGVASNRLLIRLPDGIRATRVVSTVHYYDDAGTEGTGLARIASDLATIELFKASSAATWTLTTGDNTYTEGSIEFPFAR